MSKGPHKPKTDCFAYDESLGVPRCKALTDLYCATEGKCNFYKPNKDMKNGGEMYKWRNPYI